MWALGTAPPAPTHITVLQEQSVPWRGSEPEPGRCCPSASASLQAGRVFGHVPRLLQAKNVAWESFPRGWPWVGVGEPEGRARPGEGTAMRVRGTWREWEADSGRVLLSFLKVSQCTLQRTAEPALHASRWLSSTETLGATCMGPADSDLLQGKDPLWSG